MLPTSKKVKVILYEFYRKTMANQTPIHQRSAAPEKDKVQTVTNEYIRMMKNCSRDLDPNSVETAIKKYSLDLRRGGFSKNG